MKKVAILASGSGSNAQAITEYLQEGSTGRVDSILCNKPDAYALKRAETLGIDAFTFTRDEFYHTSRIPDLLEERNTDLVVLAGFLWLVPEHMIKRFPDRIINIHPALLPKYGGKGMYGSKVHEAVIANGEQESGITIHYVNERYDEGNIIRQARCKIVPGETPDSLAEKIHQLEYQHYPRVVEQLLISAENS